MGRKFGGTRRQNQQFLMATLMAGTAIGLPAGAVAQEASARASGSIETVIVTARKREENLQDTPIAITAFTGDALERRGITSSNQLAEVTPNLILDTNAPVSASNSTAQIYIRGVGQSDFQALNDPGVGVYIDGVYHARTIGSVIELLDIERVEVLRGPQGTLFGRNTIGGAIDIKTKSPSFDGNSGFVRVTTGSRNRFDGVVAGNFVLGDGAAIRVMAATRNRDGYVRRVVDDTLLGNDSTDHLRARLALVPAENLTIDLTADYNREDENGGPLVYNRNNTSAAFQRGASFFAGCPGAVFPAPVVPVPDVNDPRCSNRFVGERTGPFASEQNFNTFSELENWGVSATVDLELDWVNIRSITSFRKLDSAAARDADGTALRILHTSSVTEDEQFSQELQFSGASMGGRLNWLFGAYYFDQTAEDESFIQLPEFVGEFILAGPVDIRSSALFSQGTYDLTDRLSVTLGLRYTDEEKDFLPQSRVANGPAEFVLADTIVTPEYIALLNSLAPEGIAPPTVVDIPPPTTIVTLQEGTFLVPNEAVDSDADAFTPMVNVSFDVTNEIMVYGTYSEGFKGGGVNFRETIPDFGSIPFEPEFVEQYEIGLKSDLFTNLLRLNAAVFQTNYDDIQVVVTPALVPTVINAAAGEVRGFELEFIAVPIENALVTGGVGYLDTKYTELSESAQNFGGLSFDSVFQNAPEWSANLSASYSIISGAFEITPRIDWSYRSKRFFDAVNTEALAQDGIGLLNLAVGIDYNDDWNVNIGVSNATDETYRIAGFSTFGAASGYEEAGFARGREWTLSLRKTF